MMQSVLAWLRRDFIRLGGRVTIRRHHALALALIVIAVVVIFAVGVFVGFKYPYRTLPRPPLPPAQTVPPANCPHVMGGCLPRPKVQNAADITATRQGCDLSNNNPAFSSAAWAAIATRNSFCVFKINESTTFVDRTARAMSLQARAHHLTVGGYDYLHVCISSPTAEAHVFVAASRSALVTGAGSLPGVGDVEFPPFPQCNVRAWLSTWIAAVHAATGRLPLIYTGAWWWQPHVGCWWPTGVLAWVSGYGVRYPFMPCGRSQLDMWQFTDHGALYGNTTSDLSIWRDGAASFQRVAGTKGQPLPPPSCGIFPATRFHLAGGVRASECNTVRAWRGAKCLDPARRPVCKSSHFHASLLRDREWFIAHHRLVRGTWVSTTPLRWGRYHLGARYAALSHIVR